MHLYKMINIFDKDYLKKLTVMLPPKDSALPMAKLTAKLVAKSLKTHIEKKCEKTSRPSSKQTKDV